MKILHRMVFKIKWKEQRERKRPIFIQLLDTIVFASSLEGLFLS
jgi:hypothetical protein